MMSMSISFAMLLAFSCLSVQLEASLRQGFYSDSCPLAEDIVRQEVVREYGFTTRGNPGIAPGLIRMHFHDCFVNGCDGSVLIDSNSTNTAEKDSPANNPSLRGFEVIDRIKLRLEGICAKTVSCADILAFAARDSVVRTGGPFYSVRSGRRDGRVSLASEVLGNIPGPTLTVDQLTKNFDDKGLTQDEMVTLSGAHTLGRAHCTTITVFNDRLYNFNGTNGPDPTLNPTYAAQLRSQCPQGSSDTSSTVQMDPVTPTVTDVNYYRQVFDGRGLFTSDQTLLTNTTTAGMVKQNARFLGPWFGMFQAAMIKMGEIGVLTGDDGEIRENCRVINM